MTRLLIFTLLMSASLHAQLMSDMNYVFQLENGAQIIYQTYSQSNSGIRQDDLARMYGTAKASGNVIRRTMTDGTNQTWLGFELHVDRLPGDPIRFRISMTPLGGFGFFGQVAPAREISNGDRILLDVLEEPGTGRKLYDTFEVGIGVEMQRMPPSRYLPAVPAAGASIELQKPELRQSTPSSMASQWRTDSSIKGATVSLTVPGKGRFFFSTKPAPGFRMEAIGEQDHLMFASGKDLFYVQCAGQVMESPGSWYLWVRHDADESSGHESVPELKLK